MRTLPALLTACCVSLLCRQVLGVRAEQRRDRRRSDLINRLFDASEEAPPPPAAPLSKWLTSLLRDGRPAGEEARTVPPSLTWARPSTGGPPSQQEAPRPRRHLVARGTHHRHYPRPGQLMRVGCVLGTCQVQNLSHRLYQLIGQNGREDSSPINPKSPHSYG